MSKAIFHAMSSAKHFGGDYKDYLEIHRFMDSSKTAFADNRHRVLTHNSWFVNTVIERVFGVYLINSEGKKVSTLDVAEQHILDDFGGKFIPTAQDYITEMNLQNWMNGSGVPSSRLLIQENENEIFIPFDEDLH